MSIICDLQTFVVSEIKFVNSYLVTVYNLFQIASETKQSNFVGPSFRFALNLCDIANNPK